MAIAEAQLAARYNRPGHAVIDHATYALVSDGDLMEGVAAEAASLAGHLKLGKLTCLYDDNRITLAVGTEFRKRVAIIKVTMTLQICNVAVILATVSCSEC